MKEPGTGPKPPTDKREINPRRWGLAAAVAILLLFMALNSQQVKVDLIVGSAQMPLIFALLISAVLGALVGWAAPRLRAHRHNGDQ
jgi:uncharacterized integral membrane protein